MPRGPTDLWCCCEGLPVMVMCSWHNHFALLGVCCSPVSMAWLPHTDHSLDPLEDSVNRSSETLSCLNQSQMSLGTCGALESSGQ